MMICTLYYHCINCGLRNNLVKLVKFMFCLFLLPFWWIKLNINRINGTLGIYSTMNRIGPHWWPCVWVGRSAMRQWEEKDVHAPNNAHSNTVSSSSSLQESSARLSAGCIAASCEIARVTRGFYTAPWTTRSTVIADRRHAPHLTLVFVYTVTVM